MNGENLSEMIKKIIENPEFAGMVGELRGDGDSESAAKDMMAKLPDVLSMVQPMLDKTQDEKGDESGAAVTELPVKSKGKKYDPNRAEKLMCALKPYMSQSRCDIIDKCLSVIQLGDVVNAFGGIEGLLGKQ